MFALPSKEGPVVQLVRMPACHAGGRGFESRPDRILRIISFKTPQIIEFEGFFVFLSAKTLIYSQ